MVIVGCLFALKTASQPFAFHNLTKKDGLSDNAVTCFEQTPDGFIWVGTANGLNRFDGKQFLQFPEDASKGQLIPPFITDLKSDGRGQLWIGTKEGLCRLDLSNDSLTIFTTKNTPTLPGNLIWDIAMDETGRIWVATDNRDLLEFLPEKNVFKAHKWREMVDEKSISTKNYRNIFRIVPGKNGLLWLCTNVGLFSFDKQRETFSWQGNLPRNWHKEFTDAWEGDDSTLWLATGGEGLRSYNLLTQEWRDFPYQADAEPATDFPQWSLLPFGKDKLLVGTPEGLGVFDKKNRLWQLHRNEPRNPVSLLPGRVLGLLTDRDGSVWIGTQNGISKLDPHLQQLPLVSIFESKDTVASYVLETTDRFFVACRDIAPLFVCDKKTLRRRAIFAPGKQPLEYVHQLVDDGNGGIWIIAFHHIFRLDKKTLKLQPIAKPADVPMYGENMQFACGALDGQGNLWLGSLQHPLLRLDTRTLALEFVANEQDYNNVPDVAWDISENVLWFCTRTGFLGKYDPTKKSLERLSGKLASDMPIHMAQTPSGNFWLTTEPGGVSFFDKKRQAFSNFYVHDGLPTNHFIDLIVDDRDKVWLYFKDGICSFEPTTKTVRRFEEEFGLDLPDWGCRFSQSPDGYFLLGTKGGFLRFHPDSLLPNSAPPRPILTSVKVLDQEMLPLLQKNSFLLQLPYNRNFLAFEFASLNFVLPKRSRFEYQLEGVDLAWVDATERTTVLYPKLSPGEYSFRLRVTDADGQAAELAQPVHIAIRPHFTNTGWFKTGLVLLSFLAAYGFYRFRLFQILKLQRLRNKIASDLHDDVASTISSISFYSDFAKKQAAEQQPKVAAVLEKIGESAREALQSIREIVWTVSPENDASANFAARIKEFGENGCAAKNIRFSFSTDLPEQWKIPPQFRKNIYLIYKEAINNALKYSDANRLDVRLEKQGAHFFMRIQDNGKGFSKEKMDRGNGFRNMQERAKENGAMLAIEGAEGTGVTITYSVKIQ